jgi:O-antigen ligase
MPIILQKLKNIPRIDYINYLILLYAFTLSFPSEIKRVIAIFMIILWITDKTKYDFKLPKTNIFLFFWIFIGYSLLSYFWSDVTIKEALDYIRRYWYYLPIFIIFKYLKKEYFEYAISFFLFGMFISEILSYGNFFKFWEIGLGHTTNPTVFIHHTTNSIFLSVTAIFLLCKIIYEKDNKKRVIYLLFFTTLTINLLVNSGRTGYIAFFLTSFILSIIIFRRKIIYIVLTICSIFILVISAYYLSPNFKSRINFIKSDVENVLDHNNFKTAVGARIGLLIISKDIIIKDPLLGTGIASSINQRNYYIKNYKEIDFSYVETLHSFHNIYIEFLIQYGIIGLFLFLLIIYEIFKIKIKNIEINLLKISVLSIYLLGSFVDILFYLKDAMFFLSFTIGIVLAKYKIEYQESIK